MPKKPITRSTELCNRPDIRDKLLKVYDTIEKGFCDQKERVDANLDYWDIFNCKLGPRQFYCGTSQIFLPITSGAIEARKTRFVNQIFPQVGRYVEVTTEDGYVPHATMSLLEHYVRKAKLRTQVVPALFVAGDVEGQYSVYVGWKANTRHTVSRETKPIQVSNVPMPEMGKVTDINSETIEDSGPYVEIIPDADLLVLPATVDCIEDALEIGGTLTIVRRWSKEKIRDLIDDEEIDEEAGESLMQSMTVKEGPSKGADTKKELAEAAGIRKAGSGFYAQIFETWMRMTIKGEGKRLVRAYFGNQDLILGCKLCPYWNDRVPVISGPVKKSPGVFKGRSLLADVSDLQIFANDTVNEGADTAHFSAMPIVMTDPAKNPRTGTMILGLAAVWECDPTSTKFVEFPPLWKDAFERIAAIKAQIFETLGVNPSMLPQQTGKGQKRNQAEIALEQQVDILTTADAVINIEEAILTPVLQRFAEYDHQFRDDDLLIRSFGEMGLRARMEKIPPIQMNNRIEFRWFGVEASRNAQQVQQQISWMNVAKQVPPQMIPGYKMNLAPLIVQITENILGPRLAPLVLQDMKSQLSVDPETENEMLSGGMPVQVSPLDDDAKHLQAHAQLLQGQPPSMENDPSGNIRIHIQMHMAQMQAKAQAAAMQASGMQPGQGQGKPPGPSNANKPQPGATPNGPHAQKGPPGMIHQDRMPAAGAMGMPRKM